MTANLQIQATKPRIQYIADGVRRDFPYPFSILGASDLEIYLGSERQSDAYSVSGAGQTNGGAVTFDVAPTSGTVVTIRRQLKIERTTDFQESGQFRAAALNDELDKITATLQQLETETNRSVRLSPTDRDSAMRLPEAADRAGKALVFDADGNVTARHVDELISPHTANNWQTLDDIPEGTDAVRFTPFEKSKLGGIEAGAQVNPADLDGVADSAARLAMSPDERSKLGGIEAGAQVNPADLDGVADSATRLAMTPDERSKLGGIEAGAQVNPADLDGVTNSATRLAMTPDERSKLGGIEASAQVNPADLDGVADSAARLAMTPDERSKLGGIEAGAQVNALSSVFGRTGDISAQKSDYNLDLVDQTEARKHYTTAEQTKLAGIQDGAQVNPTNLDGVPDSTARLAMTPAERSKLVGIEAGAQVNPGTASATAAGLMTAADKSKLDGIQAGAQVNPTNLDGVSDGTARLAMTPAERSKLVGIEAGAQVNVVSSIFGRTGAIVAQKSDYNLDLIDQSGARKHYTTAEQTKLAGIQAGAQVNPTNLDGVPDSTVRLAMTAAERTKLIGIEAGAQVNPGAASATAAGLMAAADKFKLDAIQAGAQVNPTNLDGVPDSTARLAMTPAERTKLSGIQAGAQVNPTNLDGVPDSTVRLAMTAAERTKLIGIEAGAQVNPGAASATAAGLMAAADKSKLDAIQAGAQVNPTNLDGVPDSAARLAMSTAERSKLGGIEAGAQVNPGAATQTTSGLMSAADKAKLDGLSASGGSSPAANLDGVPDGATRLAMTPAERTKLTGVETGAQVNAVASIFGRTGAIVAQKSDYNLDLVDQTGVRKHYTVAEQTKLAGIQTGAQVNPANLDGVPDSTTRLAMTAAERTKLAGIEAGAIGESSAKETSATEVAVTDRFLILRPGVQRAILPRADLQIKNIVMLNRSGTAINILAPEGKAAKGAKFDASSYIDFSLAALSAVPVNVQKFTLSFWASFDDLATTRTILSSFYTAKGALEIATAENGTVLQVSARNAAGTVIIDQRSQVGALVASTLQHIVIACDLMAPQIKIRINGQNVLRTSGFTPVLVQNGTIALNSTNLRIGARSTGGNPHLGNIAQLWFAPGAYFDLDVAATLSNFYSGGQAVNLGYNGWRPMGVTPGLFLNASGSNFATNQARPTEVGTATGTLTAASLDVPGQQSAYLIDSDGPTYALADGKSASFTTIDNPVEITRFVRLGGA